MAIFTGSGVAIVTPMNDDETINYSKLEQLIDQQIQAGTDAIIVCGTTGESATLGFEEHYEAIRCAVVAAGGRVPVIAGTGSNNTADAIRSSKTGQRYGADALLLVTPYYNKTTQKGLIEHYTKVAGSVDLPCIVYNVPSRTGCNILPRTMAALTEQVENIVAIKEASGNLSQVAELMSLCGDRIDLYSGNDDQIVPVMSLGGKGVISVLANVAPAQTHEIAASYLEGDVQRSCRLQLEAIELISALFCEVNPIPVKTAMNLMGLEVGPLRAPLCTMEEQNLQRLKTAMTHYGLLPA